jgi:hypothetical protein
MVTVDPLNMDHVYIISYKASSIWFQIFFAPLGCTAETCIIFGLILCKVVQFGLEILEVFTNPYHVPLVVLGLLARLSLSSKC